MSKMPLLQCHQLSAWYGAAQVLFELDLQVHAGEVVGLMGPNGAGKSTTLKTLMGLITQRQGALVFKGHNISAAQPFEVAQLGMGYVPEDRRIFTDLTVLENLQIGFQPHRFHAIAQAERRWTIDRVFDLFPTLAPMAQRRAAHMSGGEQQMLTLARTLMGQPDLLLLDEPSEGIAPVVVAHMIQAIQTLKSQGMSILLSEQNPVFANALCDRYYHLHQGHLHWPACTNGAGPTP